MEDCLASQSLGVLSPAYFASRRTILAWLNSFLSLSLTAVEQTASGVAVCQIFDALYPGQVKLEKVNFHAKRDYEFINNYKVLQGAFKRVGIEKEVDVEAIIKGMGKDNLAFMQWVKAFFEANAGPAALEYDAVHRRREVGGGGAAATAVRAGGRARTAGRDIGNSNLQQVTRGPVRKRGVVAKEMNRVPKALLDAEREEIDRLNDAVEAGELEQSHYYQKLVDVEGVVQHAEDGGAGKVSESMAKFLAEIKEILYLTDTGGDGEVADETQEGDWEVEVEAQ